MAGVLAGDRPKISQQFKMRLAALDARRTVRAIVMLEQEKQGRPAAGARHRDRTARAAAIAETREQVEAHLPEIDRILGLFGGKRFSARQN